MLAPAISEVFFLLLEFEEPRLAQSLEIHHMGTDHENYIMDSVVCAT